MTERQTSDWLAADEVDAIPNAATRDDGRIRAALQKARELKGLDMADVAALCHIAAPEQIEELFATARSVKEQIYGHRMVLFAPLYISNVCGNECTYCAFRASNKALPRTALSMAGIARDTAELIRQGHKRLLMVAGEGYSAANGGFQYIIDAIAAVYDVTDATGKLRESSDVLLDFADRFKAFLRKATYPIRTGTHYSTAFALALASEYAGEVGDHDLAQLIEATAKGWYLADAGAAAWEPSGDDFLSPTLVEAECLRRVLSAADFRLWFARFLPEAASRRPASLFTPASVSDRSDGKIAHLDGLNLSRAWCWRSIAGTLALNDPVRPVALASADEHLAAGLEHVAGDYMGEHWLATFALLALEA